MIDTLRLSFTDFEINMNKMNQKTTENTESKFGVNLKQSSAKDVITGNTEQELLFIDTDHVPCYGKKAWINTKDFNVDLYNGLCVVQFSAPKVLTGSNYYTSSREETRQSIQKVERDLHDMGVHTSLESANVIRTDLTNTIQTDYPISTYMPVLSMLNGKRARDKRQYAAQTMLWGNTQIQVCCYDKIAEILSYEPAANIRQYPQNSFRTELRLMNSKKIKTTLGISTAKEVYKNYDEIKGYRSQLLHEYVFKMQPEDFDDMLTGSIENMVKAYASTGKRNWFSYLKNDYGLYQLMKYTEIEDLVSIYKTELVKRGTHTAESIRVQGIRMRKSIEKQAATLMEGLTVKNIPYRELYLEIYKKFVA